MGCKDIGELGILSVQHSASLLSSISAVKHLNLVLLHCWKKSGLAATNMCPCGKRQMMSHVVNSPSRRGGGLQQLHSADEVVTQRLENALDINDDKSMLNHYLECFK